MSVLLEGDTVIQDEEALWSGLWQFSKEKKVGVSFNYQVRTATSQSRRCQIQFHNDIYSYWYCYRSGFLRLFQGIFWIMCLSYHLQVILFLYRQVTAGEEEEEGEGDPQQTLVEGSDVVLVVVE